MARTWPRLRLPGNVADRRGLLLPNEPQSAIDPGQETVTQAASIRRRPPTPFIVAPLTSNLRCILYRAATTGASVQPRSIVAIRAVSLSLASGGIDRRDIVLKARGSG